MATAGGTAVFKPVTPGQAVAILLLIENSGHMVPRWPDLRDRVLPTLLGNIRIANQGVPIQILMLVSSPVPEGQSSASAPREYNELPELKFNYHNDNHISLATVSRGITFLSAIMPGQMVARHMFIIAASEPSSNQEGADIFPISHAGASNWQRLGQTLTLSDISCHLIINPNHDTQGFVDMFQAALLLQNREEVEPWFPVDQHQYKTCLSARPVPPVGNFREIASRRSSAYEPLTTANLPRSVSYPSDLNYLADTPVTSTPQSESTSPSLVSHLQQVHGMTKKKIYGVQPTREPFFRDDERVRGKYRQGPTPLAIPSSPPSTAKAANLVNRDARRGASRSRVRSLSVSSKTTNNEPRPHPRRHSHSRRRASRLSSPESPEDGNLQSPSSIVLPSIADVPHTAHDLVSNIPPPISPIAGSLFASSSSIHTDSFSEMNGTMLRNTGIGLAEPRWLQTSYDSAALPLSAPPFTTTIPGYLMQNSDNFVTAAPDGPRMQLPPSPSGCVDMSAPSSPVKGPPSVGFSPHTSQIQLDGNTPFIFSAEAEAQAAARLAEAGLQSSGPSPRLLYPELPPLDNFSPGTLSTIEQHMEEPKFPYSQLIRPVETSFSVMDAGGTNAPSSPTFGESSSLTGWAG